MFIVSFKYKSPAFDMLTALFILWPRHSYRCATPNSSPSASAFSTSLLFLRNKFIIINLFYSPEFIYTIISMWISVIHQFQSVFDQCLQIRRYQCANKMAPSQNTLDPPWCTILPISWCPSRIHFRLYEPDLDIYIRFANISLKWFAGTADINFLPKRALGSVVS